LWKWASQDYKIKFNVSKPDDRQLELSTQAKDRERQLLDSVNMQLLNISQQLDGIELKQRTFSQFLQQVNEEDKKREIILKIASDQNSDDIDSEIEILLD
jgi:hypothetical protein